VSLPDSVVLVIAGLLGAALFPEIGLAITPGLVLGVFVPGLVFAAAYSIDWTDLRPVLGPILAVLAFAGGLFVPLSVMGDNAFTTIAKFVPTYGVSGLAHAPLSGESIQASWIINVLVWLAIFVSGAIWRFRRDTARV